MLYLYIYPLRILILHRRSFDAFIKMEIIIDWKNDVFANAP